MTIAGIEGKYETMVKCGNCSYIGIARIERGTPIPDAECPNCDCPRMLHRIV